MTEQQKKNKELIDKYPFLMPRNVLSDMIAEDYDYSYTLLDDIPNGWVKRFGEQMCEEIKEALIREQETHPEEYTEDKLMKMAEWHGIKEPPFDLLHMWRIMQLKEKFGDMRLYPNWKTKEISDIINKYSKLSWDTCIECGEYADVYSLGWIVPLCKSCASKHENIVIKYKDGENDG